MGNDQYLSALHPVDAGLRKHWAAERRAETAREKYQARLIATCPHTIIFQTYWGRWQQCGSCGGEF